LATRLYSKDRRKIELWEEPSHIPCPSPRQQSVWAKIKSLVLKHKIKEIPHLIPYLLKSGGNSDSKPAMIICPGGGYTHHAPHEGMPIARWINSLGYHAFVLHYRVFPYLHPIPLLDGLRAVRLARYHAKKWNIVPSKIGMLGFSAGGHLTSSVAVHHNYKSKNLVQADVISELSGRPDLVVLCYAVISFGKFGHKGSIRSLLGKKGTRELRDFYSNELHVNKETPPAFLWHTKSDHSVPFQNSTQFARALSDHGIEHEIHLYKKGDHGLGLAKTNPEAREWPKKCAAWLKKQKW